MTGYLMNFSICLNHSDCSGNFFFLLSITSKSHAVAFSNLSWNSGSNARILLGKNFAKYAWLCRCGHGEDDLRTAHGLETCLGSVISGAAFIGASRRQFYDPRFRFGAVENDLVFAPHEINPKHNEGEADACNCWHENLLGSKLQPLRLAPK